MMQFNNTGQSSLELFVKEISLYKDMHINTLSTERLLYLLIKTGDEIAALVTEIFKFPFIKSSKVMAKMSQTVFFVSLQLSMEGAVCISDFLLNRRNDF